MAKERESQELEHLLNLLDQERYTVTHSWLDLVVNVYKYYEENGEPIPTRELVKSLIAPLCYLEDSISQLGIQVAHLHGEEFDPPTRTNMPSAE